MRGRIGDMVLAGLAGLAVLAAGLASGPAAAQAAPLPGRGELLYATHCIACHSEQVHWRDRKVASDWPRLKQEVHRWQAVAQLGWTEADVVDVARYLNEIIYRLPQTADVVGRVSPGEAGVPAARAAR
ncbi:MAG: cytochrome C [Rubrivivax sp.]|nr:cytochrome C [Rubrivivax sp.]